MWASHRDRLETCGTKLGPWPTLGTRGTDFRATSAPSARDFCRRLHSISRLSRRGLRKFRDTARRAAFRRGREASSPPDFGQSPAEIGPAPVEIAPKLRRDKETRPPESTAGPSWLPPFYFRPPPPCASAGADTRTFGSSRRPPPPMCQGGPCSSNSAQAPFAPRASRSDARGRSRVSAGGRPSHLFAVSPPAGLQRRRSARPLSGPPCSTSLLGVASGQKSLRSSRRAPFLYSR